MRSSARVLTFGLIIAAANSAAVACDCSNCGAFGDDCSWSHSTVQTGYFYGGPLGECEKKCNAPEDARERRCCVIIEATESNKYDLSVSAAAEWFGLEAGYEDEKVLMARCENCEACSEPGCCIGPFFGHVKWSYTQKMSRRRNDTNGCYCTPCNGDSLQTATLKQYPRLVCNSTVSNSGWSPVPKTVSQICAGL